jgi:hypothetical protein
MIIGQNWKKFGDMESLNGIQHAQRYSINNILVGL